MSFEVPEGLRYLASHEWADVDDGQARIGITDFAQDELGDVVFVELPAVGEDLAVGERFGTVESIKAVSDIYSPVAGTVTGVNDALEDQPELVNEDPYGEGWMIEADLADDADVEETLDAAAYRDQIE